MSIGIYEFERTSKCQCVRKYDYDYEYEQVLEFKPN